MVASNRRVMSNAAQRTRGWGGGESGPVNESFIPAESSTLLNWIDSTRSRFWCWLFIRQATCKRLNITLPDLSEDEVPYKKFEANSHPRFDNERLAALKKYFENLERITDISCALGVMNQMLDEWLLVEDKTRDLSWLPKTQKDIAWAWDYVRKLQWFKDRGIASSLRPPNEKECYMAIIAVFDESLMSAYPYVSESIYEKNRLIVNFKAAFNKRKKTKADTSVSQINIIVSTQVKARLKVLAKERGATQRQIIERLIMTGKLD